MSVEQPSSGSPTEQGTQHDRSGWRCASRLAVLATAIVAVGALIVALTRSDGTSGRPGGEIFLQAADTAGPDPFTESTAKDSFVPPPVTPTAAVSAPAGSHVVRRVDGGAAGLYSGSRGAVSCDVEQQSRALQAAPGRQRAFASALGVTPAGVRAYLRSLTPVQLRMDTRVTNHGYRYGTATGYQAVLQAGTAVLVDDRGRPRVRCACGNPLGDPVRQQGVPRPKGDAWPSYRSSNVVFVAPAVTVVNIFVVYDPDRRDWFHRRQGDTGGKDRRTDPPVSEPTPSGSSSRPSIPTKPAEPAEPSKPAEPAKPSKSAKPSEPSVPPTTSTPSSPSSASSEPESATPELLPPQQQSPLPCVSSPTAAPASPPAPSDTAGSSATPCPSASGPPASSPVPDSASTSPSP